MIDPSKSLYVAMTPDYRGENPYQRLLVDAMAPCGVEVEFPRQYRRVLPLNRWLASLERPVDVLHLHWYESYIRGRTSVSYPAYAFKFLFELWCLRRRGVRIVWTIHNKLAHESAFVKMESWLRRRIASLSDVIIIHSEANREEVAHDLQIDASRLSVVPHGNYKGVYPASDESSSLRAEVGVKEGARLYLSLGMIRPYKGIENLIEQWNSVQGPAGEDYLLIAGKSNNETYTQTVRQLIKKSHRVIWHEGFVADEKVAAYYQAADCVVLPFSQMLTSGSLLLAMTYGKPVIAPRLGNIPEALGEADALLYDANASDGLSKALRASAEADLEALSLKTQKACDDLNWDSIGEKTFNLYKSEPAGR